MNPELLASCWTTAGAAGPLTDHEESPESLDSRIELAAKAGFTGFGLLHADLIVARDDIGYTGLAELLTQHGIRHLELEMLVDWFHEGPSRERSDEMRRDLLDAAAALGARHIKVGGDYSDREWPFETVVKNFRELCEQAADAGTRIAFEPMPFANIRTPFEALELIEATDHPAAGMIIDSWHVARAGLDFSSVATVPRSAIAAVELDDADPVVVGTLIEDTINNRRLCGEGSFDLPAFIRAILETGYDGPWGVEILSHEHRALPISAAIPAAYETTMGQFRLALGEPPRD